MPTVTQTKMKPKLPKKKVNKSDNVLDRIEILDAEPESDMKILAYGRSGTGKTTFWGSFPGPILAIICSGGLKSGELKSLKDKKLLAKKQIHKVAVKNQQEIKDLIDYQEETGKFKTVVVDHLTGMQDLVLAGILDIEDMPIQKSWGLASQQDYQACTAQCKELLKKLLNLECNVVFTAQERDFNNDADSRMEGINPYVAAALTPSLVGFVNSSCDYLIQTLIRPKMVEKKMKIGGKTSVKLTRQGNEVEFVARLAPHDIVMTKFRIPKDHKLPEFLVDPTYDKVMALLSGTAD